MLDNQGIRLRQQLALCCWHVQPLAASETTANWLTGIKLVAAALAAVFLICDSSSFKRFGESLQLSRGTELVCYSAVHALVCCCVVFGSVWSGLGLMLTTVLPRLIDSVHCATVQWSVPPYFQAYCVYCTTAATAAARYTAATTAVQSGTCAQCSRRPTSSATLL
eukprot:16942-Heterococcus_DN1.PRE.1